MRDASFAERISFRDLRTRLTKFFLLICNHRFGAKGYMVTRPQFYGLLQRHMPKEHIHTGKKIVGMDQNDKGVVLRFSDGTEARGDILIGADGAYSAVRNGLYEKLKEAKKLPPSDALPLPFSTICLVGQTLPITTEDFPDLKHQECLFRRIIGTEKMYSVSLEKTFMWVGKCQL